MPLSEIPPAGPAGAAEPPVRSAAVWAALDPLVGDGPLQVLDVGGGAGVFAVPLAQLGHTVTVVDTSADALATLRRRADLAGVGDLVRGVQGDADQLGAVPAPGGGFDLVLVHSVLEVVDEPAVTLAGIAAVLRPGGHLSVTVANRAGAVLARALGGHPVEAHALLGDRDPAPARSRTRPGRRRFGPDELLALVAGAGLTAGDWRGVSVVADLLDTGSGADPAALRRLELDLAGVSPYRDVAGGLHVIAVRGAAATGTGQP
ncbi:2-polyprenyl-3-methyl-5-hydroxy-6-metoxy-1,4-benzoquinol methylase [Klenkia marina]|uniref:2-polyprenyl-3-methyl-5-hydroxy-6-metoxy-1,4-benzoquinol methylase n=1 Tax=Klenkia marina TaxID=1960309 RepID=A0A1G4YBD9_9ACTN|nr:methyltransferase domain-containing protein [Klenkia marina]SCX50108.1 2-polyprenyl-3-methyl-5-hydroxy-6-metoxy-1,4-benzoquinol methylase [Klenkia marina]